MSSGREIKRPVTEEDVRAWERGWAEMMVTIWRENILRLGIVDTGTLHDKISHRVTDTNGQIMIAHEFMRYGIYVARGVGNGYKHDNGGQLDILDKSYRRAAGLNKRRRAGSKDAPRKTSGKARKRRDWFSSRYISSIGVLTRVERDMYGEAYMGTLSNVVQAMFGGSSSDGMARTLARF